MTSRQVAVGEIAKKPRILRKHQAANPQPPQESAAESNGLREHIAVRAYALYEERGHRQGCDLQDWLDAEREILSRQQAI